MEFPKHITSMVDKLVLAGTTTTNENGSTYFSRNGASITEYIWFNESMGQNVIEK